MCRRVLVVHSIVGMASSHVVDFNAVFNSRPLLICSSLFSPVTRPRLWWFSDVFPWPSDVTITAGKDWDVLNIRRTRVRLEDILMPGWWPCDIQLKQAKVAAFNFNCLIQHKPKRIPLSCPRGLKGCDVDTLKRWAKDAWAQAPYMYRLSNLVAPTEPRNGALRRRDHSRGGREIAGMADCIHGSSSAND